MSAFSILMWQRPLQRIWAKTIAVLLSFSFLLPSLSWAFSSASYPATTKQIVFNQKPVLIPANLATITHAFQGNDQLVILIQDLHCNYEVQNNIAQLIDRLSAEHGLKLVTVEGASLPINVCKLALYPLVWAKREIAHYLLKQGRISGPELYAATGNHAIWLEGIETPSLYTASLEQIKKFLNSESQGYILDLRAALNEIKTGVFSGPLKEFEKQKRAFREGQLSLFKYALRLTDSAERLGFSLKDYPNLAYYTSRGEERFEENVDSDALIREMEILDLAVRKRLYQTPRQVEVDEQERVLDIMERLLNISATPDDLAEFNGFPEKFKVARFEVLVRQYQSEGESLLEPEVANLDEYLADVREFYKLADARSLAFVENLKQRMEKHQTKLTVLVTGGFHTDQILTGLRSQGISYLGVKPRITRQDVANPYFDILQNRRMPLEQLLEKNQTIFAPESRFPQTEKPLTPIRDLSGQSESVQRLDRVIDLLENIGTIIHAAEKKRIAKNPELAALAKTISDLERSQALIVELNQGVSAILRKPGQPCLPQEMNEEYAVSLQLKGWHVAILNNSHRAWVEQQIRDQKIATITLPELITLGLLLSSPVAASMLRTPASGRLRERILPLLEAGLWFRVARVVRHQAVAIRGWFTKASSVSNPIAVPEQVAELAPISVHTLRDPRVLQSFLELEEKAWMGFMTPENWAMIRENFPETHREPGRYFAVFKGKIAIGFIESIPDRKDPKMIQSYMIYIDPAYRQLGLATRLFQAALIYFKHTGAKVYRVDSVVSDPAAQRLHWKIIKQYQAAIEGFHGDDITSVQAYRIDLANVPENGRLKEQSKQAGKGTFRLSRFLILPWLISLARMMVLFSALVFFIAPVTLGQTLADLLPSQTVSADSLPSAQEAKTIQGYIRQSADFDPIGFINRKFAEGTQVLTFGETHRDRACKEMAAEIIRNTPVTHVVLELDGAVRLPLEQYQRTGDASLLRLAIFRHYTAPYTMPYGDVDGFMQIIAAAVKKGVPLVFPDPRKNGGADQPQATADSVMAGKITEIVQANPQARVLVYMGAKHTSLESWDNGKPYLGRLLRDQGVVKLYTISPSIMDPNEYRMFMNLFQKAVLQDSLSQQLFLMTDPVLQAYPASGKSKNLQGKADAHIFLPFKGEYIFLTEQDMTQGKIFRPGKLEVSGVRMLLAGLGAIVIGIILSGLGDPSVSLHWVIGWGVASGLTLALNYLPRLYYLIRLLSGQKPVLDPYMAEEQISTVLLEAERWSKLPAGYKRPAIGVLKQSDSWARFWRGITIGQAIPELGRLELDARFLNLPQPVQVAVLRHELQEFNVNNHWRATLAEYATYGRLIATNVGMPVARLAQAFNRWTRKFQDSLPGAISLTERVATYDANRMQTDLRQLSNFEQKELLPATWLKWLEDEHSEVPVGVVKLKFIIRPTAWWDIRRITHPLYYDLAQHSLVSRVPWQRMSQAARLAGLKQALVEYQQARDTVWGDEWPVDFRMRKQQLDKVVEKIRRGEPVTMAFVCQMNQERSFLADFITTAWAEAHGKPITVLSGGVNLGNPASIKDAQMRKALQNIRPLAALVAAVKKNLPGFMRKRLKAFHSKYTLPEMSDQADIIFVASRLAEKELIEAYQADTQHDYSANQHKLIPLSMLTESLFRTFGRTIPSFAHWLRSDEASNVDISPYAMQDSAEIMFWTFYRAIAQGLFSSSATIFSTPNHLTPRNIAQQLVRDLGTDVNPKEMGQLVGLIQHQQARLGSEELVRRLQDSSSSEFQIAVEELSENGAVQKTTHFKRYPISQTFVQTEILPRIIQEKLKSRDRTIRITSVGTSFGYDLVEMGNAVKQALKNQNQNPMEWTIVLDGRDFSADSLAVFKQQAGSIIKDIPIEVETHLTVLGRETDRHILAGQHSDILMYRMTALYLRPEVRMQVDQALNADFLLVDKHVTPDPKLYQLVFPSVFQKIDSAIKPILLSEQTKTSMIVRNGLTNHLYTLIFDQLELLPAERETILRGLLEDYEIGIVEAGYIIENYDWILRRWGPVQTLAFADFMHWANTEEQPVFFSSEAKRFVKNHSGLKVEEFTERFLKNRKTSWQQTWQRSLGALQSRLRWFGQKMPWTRARWDDRPFASLQEMQIQLPGRMLTWFTNLGLDAQTVERARRLMNQFKALPLNHGLGSLWGALQIAAGMQITSRQDPETLQNTKVLFIAALFRNFQLHTSATPVSAAETLRQWRAVLELSEAAPSTESMVATWLPESEQQRLRDDIRSLLGESSLAEVEAIFLRMENAWQPLAVTADPRSQALIQSLHDQLNAWAAENHLSTRRLETLRQQLREELATPVSSDVLASSIRQRLLNGEFEYIEKIMAIPAERRATIHGLAQVAQVADQTWFAFLLSPNALGGEMLRSIQAEQGFNGPAQGRIYNGIFKPMVLESPRVLGYLSSLSPRLKTNLIAQVEALFMTEEQAVAAAPVSDTRKTSLASLRADWEKRKVSVMAALGLRSRFSRPNKKTEIPAEYGELLSAREMHREVVFKPEQEKMTACLQALRLESKDYPALMAPYRTLGDLEERIQEIQKVMALIGQTTPLSVSSQRAIMKRYLKTSSRAISLTTMVPRPRLDNRVNRTRAAEWIRRHVAALRPLMQSLVERLTYIDQEAFEDALEKSFVQFQQAIHDQPFVIVKEGHGKSNDWIEQLGLEMGMPQPKAEVDLSSPQAIEKMARFIQQGYPLLIADDAAFSGGRVISMLGSISAAAHLAQVKTSLLNLQLVIPFMTAQAKTKIQNSLPGTLLHIYNQQLIETLGDMIPELEAELGREVENRLERMYAEEYHAGLSLTYFQHKVPDEESALFPVLEGRVVSPQGEEIDTIPFVSETQFSYTRKMVPGTETGNTPESTRIFSEKQPIEVRAQSQFIPVATAKGPLQLEILSRHPASKSLYPPLLFVHGIVHGAWCWDEHYLNYFAKQGFEVYAVSLRGHGQSQGKEGINRWSLKDYVADVKTAVDWLKKEKAQGVNPVLVGHSMGGVIVQKYMEQYPEGAAGTVFLAVAPRMSLFKYLFNVRKILLRFVAAIIMLDFKRLNPLLAEQFFFLQLPAAQREKYIQEFSNESLLAIFQLLFNGFLRSKAPIQKPTLVIGAEQDRLFPIKDVEKHAKDNNSSFIIVPGSHDLMLEPGWEQSAQHLTNWLLANQGKLLGTETEVISLPLAQQINRLSAAEVRTRLIQGYQAGKIKYISQFQDWQKLPHDNKSIAAGIFLLRKINGHWSLLLGQRSVEKAKDKQGFFSAPVGGVNQPINLTRRTANARQTELLRRWGIQVDTDFDPLNQRESITEAAQREAEEEVGIKGEIVARLNDFRGNHPGILVNFMVYVEESEDPVVGGNGELVNYQWIPLDLILAHPAAEVGAKVEEELQRRAPGSTVMHGLKTAGIKNLQLLLQQMMTEKPSGPVTPMNQPLLFKVSPMFERWPFLHRSWMLLQALGLIFSPRGNHLAVGYAEMAKDQAIREMAELAYPEIPAELKNLLQHPEQMQLAHLSARECGGWNWLKGQIVGYVTRRENGITIFYLPDYLLAQLVVQSQTPRDWKQKHWAGNLLKHMIRYQAWQVTSRELAKRKYMPEYIDRELASAAVPEGFAPYQGKLPAMNLVQAKTLHLTTSQLISVLLQHMPVQLSDKSRHLLQAQLKAWLVKKPNLQTILNGLESLEQPADPILGLLQSLLRQSATLDETMQSVIVNGVLANLITLQTKQPEVLPRAMVPDSQVETIQVMGIPAPEAQALLILINRSIQMLAGNPAEHDNQACLQLIAAAVQSAAGAEIGQFVTMQIPANFKTGPGLLASAVQTLPGNEVCAVGIDFSQSIFAVNQGVVATEVAPGVWVAKHQILELNTSVKSLELIRAELAQPRFNPETIAGVFRNRVKSPPLLTRIPPGLHRLIRSMGNLLPVFSAGRQGLLTWAMRLNATETWRDALSQLPLELRQTELWKTLQQLDLNSQDPLAIAYRDMVYFASPHSRAEFAKVFLRSLKAMEMGEMPGASQEALNQQAMNWYVFSEFFQGLGSIPLVAIAKADTTNPLYSLLPAVIVQRSICIPIALMSATHSRGALGYMTGSLEKGPFLLEESIIRLFLRRAIQRFGAAA